MSNLRFTGEWPPPQLWAKYPNWEYALDEENVEGQDETTIRPSEEQRYVNEDVAFTAGEATLADGKKLPALIEVNMGQIGAVNVFINETDAWRVYHDLTEDIWKSFVEDWLHESERSPAVSFDDTTIFPLSICSTVPFEVGTEPYRFYINPDGTISEPT